MSEQEIMQKQLTKQLQQYTGKPLSETNEYTVVIKNRLESRARSRTFFDQEKQV
jgi:hypothetical protein